MTSTSRHLATMPKPRKSSIFLSANSPFTYGSLHRVREAIQNTAVNVETTTESGRAAVLLPLINVDNKPAILFQVRASSIRHGGQVG